MSLPLNNKLYSLQVNQSPFKTNIQMNLRTDFYHTGNLPSTLSQLKQALPGVLKSKCFNEGNLPFSKEVLNTEIGHLFEHILLEYLCSVKISQGAKRAVFKGVTTWDWKKDVKGTYHITLYISPRDSKFLLE